MKKAVIVHRYNFFDNVRIGIYNDLKKLKKIFKNNHIKTVRCIFRKIDMNEDIIPL